ncbi:MAG: hypothetical protein ACLFT6_01855 [Bacteroidales bacterium]
MTTIAEKALDDRFKEVMQSDFDPTQFRLSNTGKCRRMRMMKVLGYEAEEIDESTAQTFERGNLLENWFVNQLVKKYPRKTRKQVEVHTPFGDTGHMDIWFPNPPEKAPTIIEVKSVHEKGRYYLPNEDHINQVQAYMHFFTDNKGNRRSNRAEIIYIFFGRKLESDPYVIEYDPEKGKEIEEELKTLHRWKEEQFVPDIPDGMSPDQYPCFWTTSDGNQGNCPYYHHCWGGEQSGKHEDIPVFDDDPTLEELLDKYQSIKSEYSNANKKVRAIKKKKKKMEKAIDKNLDIRDTDAAIVKDTRIKRSKVSGRTYWKPKKALKQGLIDEETLKKIEKVSDKSNGYFRYYIKEITGG